MHAWSPLRARVTLFFCAALAFVGLVPVIYFLGLVGWQAAALFQRGPWVPLPVSLIFTDHPYPFLPQLPWAWFMSPDSLLPVHTALSWILSRVHVGAVLALLGVALVAVGALGVLRQRAALRAHKQWREDRARRVHDYRRDDGLADSFGRREPFMVEYPKESFESTVRTKRWSAGG